MVLLLLWIVSQRGRRDTSAVIQDSVRRVWSLCAQKLAVRDDAIEYGVDSTASRIERKRLAVF